MTKGKTMPIYLPQEFETEIVGHGDGFISINQKNEQGEVVIWLSVHQFETIFNLEKRIMKEAYESNDSQNGNENIGQG
jgi:hypothetical protein